MATASYQQALKHGMGHVEAWNSSAVDWTMAAIVSQGGQQLWGKWTQSPWLEPLVFYHWAITTEQPSTLTLVLYCTSGTECFWISHTLVWRLVGAQYRNTDSRNTDGWNTDSRNTDSRNTDSRNTDSRNSDSWNSDSRNSDSWNSDSLNSDSLNSDSRNSDSWNSDSQSPSWGCCVQFPHNLKQLRLEHLLSCQAHVHIHLPCWSSPLPPQTHTGPLSVRCTEGIPEGNSLSQFVSRQPHGYEKPLCPLCHFLPGEGCRTVYDGE